MIRIDNRFKANTKSGIFLLHQEMSTFSFSLISFFWGGHKFAPPPPRTGGWILQL